MANHDDHLSNKAEFCPPECAYRSFVVWFWVMMRSVDQRTWLETYYSPVCSIILPASANHFVALPFLTLSRPLSIIIITSLTIMLINIIIMVVVVFVIMSLQR
jgi:hypothetical protein